MALAAGDLRHRVSLQRQVQITNSFGETKLEWEEFAQVWAQIAPLSAREFLAAQQINSEVQARIVIRYRPDVDASVRIVHCGKIYDIHGVLSDVVSGLEYLTLPVSAGINEG